MRKLMVVALAALLAVVVAGPVAAGANVSNTSGSALAAEGSWYTDGPDGYAFGYVSAWQEQGASAAFIQFYSDAGAKVDCTPADPTDDAYGFVGSYRFGYGTGTLAVGRGYGSAAASGSVDIYGADIDDCAGTWLDVYEPGAPVSFDLTATGPKVMARGTWSFHIPSQFNSHSSYSSTYRIASGTATIGDGELTTIDGAIGKVSWRDHSNG